MMMVVGDSGGGDVMVSLLSYTIFPCNLIS